MKQDKHRFLRKRPGRKPGKAGSSLALVMMIGAALVIWVMCIMPLMTTTGTTAIQTEEKYDDYLESRSSIEYCKSELERMVNEGNIPSTFAVVKKVAADGNVTYTAYQKIAGDTNAPEHYPYYVDEVTATTDEDDEPRNDDNGKLVTAICAVVPDDDDPGVYNITIQTYHSGEKGQVYKLKYTLSGSLLIYPESYNQNQALPLSDFVLVDGKLGDNEVWKSSLIEKGIGSAVGSDNGTGDFTEELLPYDLSKDSSYASSQEYPAVFKKTAEAAELSGTGNDHGIALTNGEFTNETWEKPTASTQEKDGSVRIQNDNGKIRVYLYANGEAHEISNDDDCKVYLNGETYKDNLIPGNGYYSVTVDFDAKSYPKDDPVVNILPISGLSVGTVGSAIPTETQSLNGSSSVESVVQEESDTYKVTLADAGEGILYGYCSSQDGSDVKWVSEREISGLSGEKTYFFYICRPARMIDGVYYSDFVQYVGMIYPKTLADHLEDGKKYLVLGGEDRNYAMTSSLKAQQLSLSNGFIIIHNSNDSSIDALSWTVRENTDTENEWYFCSNDDKTNNPWLYMDGSCENVGSIFKPKYEWKLSLGTMGQKSSDAALAVKFVDVTTASVTKRFEHKVLGFVVDSAIGYIAYSNNRFMATDTSSTVSFLRIPTVPNINDIDGPTESYSPTVWTATFDEDIMALVKTEIRPEVNDIVTLYANGSPVPAQTDGKYILAAGKYSLAADIVVDGIQYCVSLGDLTVNKYTFSSGYPMAVCTTDSSDEMTVHVSYTDGHGIGSKYWFGYREKDAKDFTWFPATSEDGLSRSFRLSPDKTYEFAVKECGTMNYNGCESTSPYAEWQVTPIQVELKATDENHPLKLQFSYDIDENGTPTWYALPNATAVDGGATVIIYPYRVHLVFGADDGNGGITWHEAYNSEKDGYFGVYIDNSNYSGNRDSSGKLNLNAEHAVLQIVQPINFSKSGGHTSSVMRGESLYFMGEGNSIKTYGNKIYLYTDLLVLKNDITGGTNETTGKAYPIGEVWVKPYSDGDDKDTLFFNPNKDSITIGSTEFEGRTFYKIAPNTNLCGPTTPSQIKRFGKLSSEDAYKAEKKEIQKLFREKAYPEINLDIAYADDAQLAHIVSGETIRWTNDGVLGGSGTSYNESYAVCAYVSKISETGAVSYKANRVLIAAENYRLNVPVNVTFATRYLSIDADEVIQGSSKPSFKIYNLAQDQNFIDKINEGVGFTTYVSKTLQIDFERLTSVKNSSGAVVGKDGQPVGPAICRYEAGTDLFDGDHILPLMAEYLPSELTGYLNRELGSLLYSNVHTVDRYVALKGEEGNNTVNATSAYCKLNIYANYVYLDNVDFHFKTIDGDVRFHTQESGYTEKEYLGFFKEHSADSYNGTLVYLPQEVTIVTQIFSYEKTVKIPAGFYYVPADPDGVSIRDLKNYAITAESLKDIAVYVDPKTGALSNAFVDTGIFDNISSGLGGFSGGNVG